MSDPIQKKETILVTGAGGFLGEAFSNYFIHRKQRVIALYRNRRPVIEHAELVQCDMAKGILIEKEIDVIVHCAAQMKNGTIAEYLENTVNSTRALLRFAEEKKVKKLIYLSSISVYGDVNGAVNEESDCINLDDYGLAKRICERMVEESSINCRTVLRLPRTLGKKADLSYPWLPLTAKKMREDKPVFYFNPELMYNNIAYVDDIAEFILHLIQENQAGYQILVLGSLNSLSVIEILCRLKKELHSDSILIEKPAPIRNTCYSIDIRKAQQHGYRPGTIEEILNRFAADIS